MSSKNAILDFFKKETGKKHKSALNEWTIRRLLEEGKELTIFENGRKKGISLENPLTRLFVRGVLNKQEYFVGKKYCNDYELANVSHHARPSWDGSAIGSSKAGDFYNQSQIEAVKRVATAKGKLIANNIGRNKQGKVISRKYLEVLEVVFEKQTSIIIAETKLNMTRLTIERKVKEICEILNK